MVRQRYEQIVQGHLSVSVVHYVECSAWWYTAWHPYTGTIGAHMHSVGIKPVTKLTSSSNLYKRTCIKSWQELSHKPAEVRATLVLYALCAKHVRDIGVVRLVCHAENTNN